MAAPTPTVSVGDRTIGPGHPCFVVAEIGFNHCGSIELAEGLIDAAAETGVDAVKLQTLDPDEMYAPENPRHGVMSSRAWSVSQYRELMDRATDKGLIFFSTAFDIPSADLLNEVGIPLFKIGSGEINHTGLLRHLGGIGKPLILSTGVADINEIEEAIEVIAGTGHDQLIVLHCVSEYPTPVERANVRGVQTLADRFGRPTGISDHTLTSSAAYAAVSLGACVVEKHFSVSRLIPDGDNDIAVLPDDMMEMVRTVREIEAALGEANISVTEEEEKLRGIIRKGIYTKRDIAPGETISHDAIVVRRPSGEISASRIDEVIGKTAAVPIAAGSELAEEHLSG